MSNKPLQFGSIDEFRKAAKEAAEPVAEARVRASFDTEVKFGEGDSRTLSFTISSKSVDRMGDTIDPAGWDLNAYLKNPVVLWAHDSTLLPVAKAPRVWFDGGKMKADAEFTPQGLARFNDTVFEMYKQGFLSATSVGFIPLKYAFTDDPTRRFGMDFLEQELLEFSCVPVPANSDALIEGRAAGIDIVPVLDWAEEQIKRCGDNSRIIKLAENVLGGNGDDALTLAWAERIVAAKQLSIIPMDRLAAVKDLVEEFRSDAKKSAGSKGASGIYRRCANRIEKAISDEVSGEPQIVPADVQEQEQEPVLADAAESNVVEGFAAIAARRLTTVRHKTA